MKKIIALILAVGLLLALASCGGGSDIVVPDGYQLASAEEYCDYRLFVPSAWVTESGKTNYTMAAVTVGGNKCTLSVAEIATAYTGTVDGYWQTCLEDYGYLSNFTAVEEGAQALVGSGENARNGYRYVFTGTFNGTSYKYQQIFLVHGNAFSSALYCITFTSTAEHYDMHLEALNSILGYFYFK
jgi:hypothetical protein